MARLNDLGNTTKRWTDRVNDHQRQATRLAAPVRSFAQRFAYIGLVLAAAVLMLVGKMEPAAIERARAHVTDAVAPILDAASRPVDAVQNMIGEGRSLIALREENAQLRDERDKLLQWQMVARELDQENKALRELLRYVPQPGANGIAARVIGDAGGAFARTLILSAGRREGVRKGQAVVTGAGLVGRVQEVGRRSSRLLLLADLNSRIPVVLETSRTRGVAAGNNGEQLRLVHLPQDAVVEPGDRVVTSGHGGGFPPGIPVGVISATGEVGVEIQPFVDPARLEIVRVLDYGLDGILDIIAEDRQ